MSIVVLDGVVDNDLRQLILSKFDLLAPGARTALPEVLVPKLGHSMDTSPIPVTTDQSKQSWPCFSLNYNPKKPDSNSCGNPY